MISVRRSLRILRRHWKLTAIAVFSLSIAMALGVISLSISEYSLAAASCRSGSRPPGDDFLAFPDEAVGQISYPDYKYFRENNHVFTDVAAAPNSISVIANSDGTREVKLVIRPVSDNYFASSGAPAVSRALFSRRGSGC